MNQPLRTLETRDGETDDDNTHARNLFRVPADIHVDQLEEDVPLLTLNDTYREEVDISLNA